MNNDLISREAAIDHVKSVFCKGCNNYDGIRCRSCEVEDVLDVFEGVPPVDAEPVRHGRWIENGPDWVCSYCATEFKDEIEFIKLDYDYYMTHYCPHCGAKMDLEAQNE